MPDPATEVSRKVFAEYWPDQGDFEFNYSNEGRFGIEVAREMAKSVQELIAEARTWKPYSTRDIGDAYCAGTVEDFLDELSKRVYPSEELGL